MSDYFSQWCDEECHNVRGWYYYAGEPDCSGFTEQWCLALEWHATNELAHNLRLLAEDIEGCWFKASEHEHFALNLCETLEYLLFHESAFYDVVNELASLWGSYLPDGNYLF